MFGQSRGKSGSELRVLLDIRRPLPEEPLQPAAQYKARLRELRPLEAEKKCEAAKRGQVAKILERKRVHDLRGLCGELAIEANGIKSGDLFARISPTPSREYYPLGRSESRLRSGVPGRRSQASPVGSAQQKSHKRKLLPDAPDGPATYGYQRSERSFCQTGLDA
jgi:hypothetical protein